ncbi:MAG: right-handed parallel beta-helix repeat-containing protein [Planctomycetota bacterium]
MNPAAALITALSASLSFSAALAGPLTPPPGAVAPTGKTTDEIEPRTPISGPVVITEPGSYYLTGDIVANTGAAIVVSASDVTIDLNRFALVGNGAAHGVMQNTTGFERVTVRNGTVTAFGGTGIQLPQTNRVRIENVYATFNGFEGIALGAQAVVINSSTHANANDGMDVGSGSVVSGCTSNDNGLDGLDASTAVSVVNSVFRDNTSAGIDVGAGASIEGCSTERNGVYGIDAGSNSTVRGCTSRNDETGIRLSTSSIAEGCSVGFSTAYGIDGATSSVLRGNTVLGCDIAGIRVSSNAVVIGNALQLNAVGANTAIGLLVTSSDNRIEANSFIDNDIGLDVNGSGNLIIRNSATGNGTVNWDIVANNRVGPIVSAPNSPMIMGNTGGAGVGSTNPWANITY